MRLKEPTKVKHILEGGGKIIFQKAAQENKTKV